MTCLMTTLCVCKSLGRASYQKHQDELVCFPIFQEATETGIACFTVKEEHFVRDIYTLLFVGE